MSIKLVIKERNNTPKVEVKKIAKVEKKLPSKTAQRANKASENKKIETVEGRAGTIISYSDSYDKSQDHRLGQGFLPAFSFL